MNAEELKIPVRKEKFLWGTLYTASDGGRSDKGLVILCHGFTGDQNEWGRFVKTANQLNIAGFDALTFDFAGSGKNKREPVLLSKQISNLMDVYEWAVSVGYNKLATIGLSFGGITSLFAQSPKRYAAVFWAPGFYLEEALSPVEKFFSKVFGFLFSTKTIKRASKNNDPILVNAQFLKEMDRYDSNGALKESNKPALIIQGTADKTVNAELNYKAINYFPDELDCKLVKVEGATHDFDGEHLDQFIDHSIEWLHKHLN